VTDWYNRSDVTFKSYHTMFVFNTKICHIVRVRTLLRMPAK